jgi:hypothetical protein
VDCAAQAPFRQDKAPSIPVGHQIQITPGSPQRHKHSQNDPMFFCEFLRLFVANPALKKSIRIRFARGRSHLGLAIRL